MRLNHRGSSDFATAWAKGFAKAVREESRDGHLDFGGVHRLTQRSDPSHLYGPKAALFADEYHGNAPVAEAHRWGQRYARAGVRRAADNDRKLRDGLRLPPELQPDFEVITGVSLQRGQGATIASQLARLANGLIYESEIEATFAPFSQHANRKFELDETSVRRVLGLATDHLLAIEPGRDFFTIEARDFQRLAEAADQPWLTKHYERMASQAWAMQRAVARLLTNVKLIDTNPGGKTGQLYLIGRTKNGDLAGLETNYA